MKQLVMIEPEELRQQIERALENALQAQNLNTAEPIEELLPWITREQAAHILRSSTSFVDRLVSAGRLQPHNPYKNRPQTIRFKTSEVLDLRRRGVTGRKHS